MIKNYIQIFKLAYMFFLYGINFDWWCSWRLYSGNVMNYLQWTIAMYKCIFLTRRKMKHKKILFKKGMFQIEVLFFFLFVISFCKLSTESNTRVISCFAWCCLSYPFEISKLEILLIRETKCNEIRSYYLEISHSG